MRRRTMGQTKYSLTINVVYSNWDSTPLPDVRVLIFDKNGIYVQGGGFTEDNGSITMKLKKGMYSFTFYKSNMGGRWPEYESITVDTSKTVTVNFHTFK